MVSTLPIFRLPFHPPLRSTADSCVQAINEHFRHSLVDAKALFTNARREALSIVYKQRVPSRSGSAAVAANYEEVAASCGYFSSSLEDFAEDMVTFLDILEELKADVNRYPRHRTWTWLKFWQSRRKGESGDEHGTFQLPFL
jgi:hypothetical protein